MRKLQTQAVHHITIVGAGRQTSIDFWEGVLGMPFVHEVEARPSPSFDDLIERYGRTQADETRWLENAAESDLDRTLENALIPNGRCSVAQAFVQVCLHSHGHRAQCAKLLRRHGTQPPPTDFILWLTDRPAAAWSG